MSMLTRARHILLPLLLIAVGLWLLSGCIYIPTFDSVKEGRNAAREVGESNSKRPLRVGSATRDDVIRMLGEPPVINLDRSKIAYMWGVRRGVTVMPLCFAAQTIEGQRAIVLEFDAQGLLRSYRLLSANQPAFSLMHPGSPSVSLDPDLRANPDYDPWARYRHHPSTTRPEK